MTAEPKASPSSNAEIRSPRGKVLMVTSTFPRWQGDDCPEFVGDLARDLDKIGWCVDVLAPHAKGAAREEQWGRLRVRRFRYAWPAGAQCLTGNGGALSAICRNPLIALLIPFFVVAQLVALIRMLSRNRYDIVHSHWLLPQGVTAALAARLCGVRHIASAHGSDVTAIRGPISTWLKRWVVACADAVTVNSGATAECVASLGGKAVAPALIPLGVETGRRAAPAAVDAFARQHRRGDGPLILFAGRLSAEKGTRDLIDAMPEILASLPDAVAVVAGAGSERPTLEQRTEELGLADNVRFVGWLDRTALAAALAAADMLVVPSHREGQGLVALEAMVAGTPVIAARVGGLPEAVKDGETGLLIPPASPPALAEAVVRLARDTNLSERLTQAASNRVREAYSNTAAAEAFAALYASALEARPDRLSKASQVGAQRV